MFWPELSGNGEGLLKCCVPQRTLIMQIVDGRTFYQQRADELRLVTCDCSCQRLLTGYVETLCMGS